jgi:hypothetical protein
MIRIAILLATAALAFAEGPAARAQFSQLKTLAGKWEGKSPDGHTSQTSYEVISSGTALLERMAHDSMTSMYHVDGDRVLLNTLLRCRKSAAPGARGRRQRLHVHICRRDQRLVAQGSDHRKDGPAHPR